MKLETTAPPADACLSPAFLPDRMHRPGIPRRHTGWGAERAFSMIELLVVVALIGILAAMSLPTLTKEKERGQRIGCSGNLKELQIGWLLYLADNNDTMPPNAWDSVTGDYAASPPGSWVVGNARENTGTNIMRGVQWPYNPLLRIYHCPADKSLAKDGITPRFRSYALNNYLGHPDDDGPTTAWYKLKGTQLTRPAKVASFVCENEGSIEDGIFAIYPAPSTDWLSLPSSRHNHGGCFAFCDGHAEYWKWKGPMIYHGRPQNAIAAELPDLRQMQECLSDPDRQKLKTAPPLAAPTWPLDPQFPQVPDSRMPGGDEVPDHF
jgi:prepilin-type N-terminal cleavage/methylation domain-containing protein/prepilin-type processing-associated H-X9-DG protein